jgi:hypothetical protein
MILTKVPVFAANVATESLMRNLWLVDATTLLTGARRIVFVAAGFACQRGRLLIFDGPELLPVHGHNVSGGYGLPYLNFCMGIAKSQAIPMTYGQRMTVSTHMRK